MDHRAPGFDLIPLERRLRLTTKEASTLMGVSESTIRRWFARGLARRRFGGQVYTSRAAIEAWCQYTESQPSELDTATQDRLDRAMAECEALFATLTRSNKKGRRPPSRVVEGH